MKHALFLIAGIGMLAAIGAANAADSDYPQVDVISVIPRSPDVKPLVMSVPASGHRKQITVADSRLHSFDKAAGKFVTTADEVQSRYAKH